jgi:hypothetical protein
MASWGGTLMRLDKPVVMVVMLLVAAVCSAAEPPFEQKALVQLTTAIQNESLSDFISLGDEQFRAMPPAKWEKMVAKFSPLLKKSYRSTCLGDFKDASVRVHYWRLEFPDEPHDWLLKVAVGDGKVKGVLITRP